MAVEEPVNPNEYKRDRILLVFDSPPQAPEVAAMAGGAWFQAQLGQEYMAWDPQTKTNVRVKLVTI